MKKLAFLVASALVAGAIVPASAFGQATPQPAQGQFIPDAAQPGAFLPGEEGTVGAPVISTTDVGDGSTVVVLQDGTVSREWGTRGEGNVMYPDGSVIHCVWNGIAPSPHLTCT